MKLPFSHKCKNTFTCGRVLTEYLLNTGRAPQTAERARNSPGNRIGKKIKRKMRKESGWDLHPWEGAVEEEGFLTLEGSCGRGRVPAPWEAPSPSGRSTGTERELCRLRGEYNTWFVAGRTETYIDNATSLHAPA